MQINIRPVITQQVPVNMNKINKLIKSKAGIEAARRYEENLRHIDYWHPDNAKWVAEDAVNSLYRYISAVFQNIKPQEQSVLAAQIQYNVKTKINDMINALDGIQLYNVGKAGDEVLKCAMERDIHLDIVESILNEAKIRGQKTLNQEQTKTAEIEMRQATAYDDRRKEYAQARIEAIDKNLQIAAENGPKVLEAYHYLYDLPSEGKK